MKATEGLVFVKEMRLKDIDFIDHSYANIMNLNNSSWNKMEK